MGFGATECTCHSDEGRISLNSITKAQFLAAQKPKISTD